MCIKSNTAITLPGDTKNYERVAMAVPWVPEAFQQS